jgi:CheY-like chemotaxis protein
MATHQARLRILLIEDDYGNRMLFTDFLKYCGYDVLALADGTEALPAMQQFDPHLVLLDLKLPSMNGLSILDALKQDPYFQQIPVVIISGYAFDSDRSKALSLGAIAYLVKPVPPQRLRSTLEAALGKPVLRPSG